MADAKQTPYIVFEYVEGLDVSDLIDAEALSLDDSVRIVREAAEGLGHLHKHGVYHQDVKPSNLLWTDKGVRIIDFNVAVSENDEVQGRWRNTPLSAPGLRLLVRAGCLGSDGSRPLCPGHLLLRVPDRQIPFRRAHAADQDPAQGPQAVQRLR